MRQILANLFRKLGTGLRVYSKVFPSKKWKNIFCDCNLSSIKLYINFATS